MDVSESECNILNENLSQSDSSEVQTNVIAELNYDEHIEPSVIVKEASYFNIFKCGRNIIDKFDVTYQREFTASEATSSVPTGLYQISTARERYYDMMAGHIKENNVGMDIDKIRKAVSHVKSEDEEEHERNIENMVQDDDYKSRWKIKDATVATGFKTVTYQVIRMKSLQH